MTAEASQARGSLYLELSHSKNLASMLLGSCHITAMVFAAPSSEVLVVAEPQ